MKVVYTPEGQQAQEWDFLPARIRESRAEMIERRYAKLIGEKSVPFEQFRMAALQDSASARRVLLWHLLSMQHPSIRIEDVDPLRGELKITASKSELGELRMALETAGGMEDGERETMLAMIDAQIAAAPDDEAGKALSPISGDDTGSPSPTPST
jgi:hypothetical protein